MNLKKRTPESMALYFTEKIMALESEIKALKEEKKPSSDVGLNDWFKFTDENGFISIIRCDWNLWRIEPKQIFTSENAERLPEHLQESLNKWYEKK